MSQCKRHDFLAIQFFWFLWASKLWSELCIIFRRSYAARGSNFSCRSILDFEIFAKISKPKTEIFYSCGPCLHDPIRSNSLEGQQRRGAVKAQALIFHGFWENGKKLITAESHPTDGRNPLCLPNMELFSETLFEDILVPTERRNRGFLPVCQTHPNVFPLTKLKMASFFPVYGRRHKNVLQCSLVF